MKSLVLGLGNLLLTDEGFGVHLVRHLQEHYTAPPGVELVDGGTLGLLVAHLVEGCHRLVIVDALDLEAPAGTCVRLARSDFFHNSLRLKLSPHQIGVQELLLLLEMRGTCPEQVELFGIVPAELRPGTTLSPTLQRSLLDLAMLLASKLGLQPRPSPCPPGP